MASSNKTPLLNLNSWLGTDKPKREDFNQDNEKIDNFLGNHIEDMVSHVTAADRLLWNSPDYVVGSYTGNGEVVRRVTLGFQAAWGMVFKVDEPPESVMFSSSSTFVYMGIFTPLGSSQGVVSEATGFMVTHQTGSGFALPAPRFNENGEQYVYIAFQPKS